MAKTSKSQTGLTLTRDGNKFTFSWKLGDNYESQWWDAAYQYNGSDYYDAGVSANVIGAKVTSRTITLAKADWFPNTKEKITGLRAWINGHVEYYNNSKDASKTFSIKIPKVPTLQTTPSDSLGNTCTWSWSVTNDTKSSEIFTDCEWQTILVANSTETDGSKLAWKTNNSGWQTGTSGLSSSKTIAENNVTISSGSHTRWFRVRSRGPAGVSAWKYGKRVYALPNAPKITKTQTTKIPSGYQVLVNWSSAANAAYPVEENVLEYLVDAPGAGLSVPAGANWTEAQTVKRVGTNNSGLIIYSSELDPDEVIFTRVRAIHILSENASAPVIAKLGTLEAPTITDVTVNTSTYAASITATNNCSIPDSFLVVVYRTASKPNNTMNVGIIPAGSSTTTMQLPNFSKEKAYAIGVYAAVGTYQAITRADGVSSYSVAAKMMSSQVWNASSVPQAPTGVSVSQLGEEGNVRITWNWTWADATSAIISWADHEDAWQSTDEPDTFEVTETNANTWNIAGLETGKTWYFRVRLKEETSESVTYSPWSKTVSLDMSSAPLVPVLTLSNSIITEDGNVTGYWVYTSGDGTSQAYAEICEATIANNVITYGNVLGSTQSAMHITIYAKDGGWLEGETHYLAVRVMSGSGHLSDDWSAPVPVTIASPIYSTITQMSLTAEAGDEGTLYYLESLPLTATITGAGAGGTTTLIIERAADYSIERPDGTSSQSFQGETIAIYSQTGESQITIEKDMLIGLLDDGATYNLIAIVQDGLGQYDETIIPFEVRWTNQAILPEGNAYIYENVGVIEPIAPAGASQDARCDIYRLSSELPELIVEAAEFGEKYVDPYPTIGEQGGYRIVYLTEDGDYITVDNELAWIDLPAYLEQNESIIDFNGEQITMFYDTSQENSWEKDFRETKYLGGSIQGDWNSGVRRGMSFEVSYVTWEDEEKILQMKRLAEWPGICHIRTRDGSSFDCDIQVSEGRDYTGNYIRAAFSLSITRIEPEQLAGVPYDNYFQEESEE